MITILLAILLALCSVRYQVIEVSVIPPVPNYAPNVPASGKSDDLMTWGEWHREEFSIAAREFDMLFNSYETKRAKNGAMMIRRPGEKSFKFARKA